MFRHASSTCQCASVLCLVYRQTCARVLNVRIFYVCPCFRHERAIHQTNTHLNSHTRTATKTHVKYSCRCLWWGFAAVRAIACFCFWLPLTDEAIFFLPRRCDVLRADRHNMTPTIHNEDGDDDGGGDDSQENRLTF